MIFHRGYRNAPPRSEPADLTPHPAAAVRAAGPGRPLTGDVRAVLETPYGQDFSQVRVHDDRLAAESAAGVRAKAFTVGTDIFFGAGHYRPETPAGKRLLAHELAHVVQHRSGQVSLGAEGRADRAADTVVRGGSVAAAELGGSPETLARQSEDGADLFGAAVGRLRAPALATFAGFAPNSATLSAADRRSLSSSVELIRGVALRTLGRIVLAGHTAPGEPTSLGGRRALSVANALIEAGVPSVLIGFGESTPGGRSVDVTLSATAPQGERPPALPDLLSPRVLAGLLPPRDPFLLTTPLPPGAQLPAECRKPVDPSSRFTTTRAGKPGDAVSAIRSIPEIACALLALQEIGLAPLRRLSTGQQWGLGLGLAGLFAPPLTIAIVHSQEARDLAVQGLGSAPPVGFSLGTVPVQIRVMGQLRPRETPGATTATTAPPPDLSGPVSVTVPALVPREWLAPGGSELRLDISVDLMPVIDRLLFGPHPAPRSPGAGGEHGR